MHASIPTQRQIELIQESFSLVEPIAEQAAALFYVRLFELDPSLKSLFPRDLSDQGRKLMRAIGLLVRSLNDLDTVRPVLQTLGERHAGYGVQESHYGTVGQALIWTLNKGLGDNFDGQTQDAWLCLYGLVSATMIEAAEAAELPLSA